MASSSGGPATGDVPSGATMQPRYMGRTMNTYPVSDPEMEQISSLNAQATAMFSIATFLIGIGISVWINAMFYKELTPEAHIASIFVAPFLVGFGILSAVCGCWTQHKRRGAWARIKAESAPVQTIVARTAIIAEEKEREAAAS
jgi:hypothetical protein